MTDEIDQLMEDRRFCPICGHEGHDEMCPICNEKTHSLAQETERLAKVEDEKSELFDDPQESLETLEEQEEEQVKKDDGQEDPII